MKKKLNGPTRVIRVPEGKEAGRGNKIRRTKDISEEIMTYSNMKIQEAQEIVNKYLKGTWVYHM